MVMVNRNYKAHSDIGLSPYQLGRVVPVLDTGVGPNFIRADTFPLDFKSRLLTGPVQSVYDANHNPLDTMGHITLRVQVGSRLSSVGSIFW